MIWPRAKLKEYLIVMFAIRLPVPKIRKYLLTVLAILLVVLAGRVYIFLNSVLVSIPTEKYLAPEFPYYDGDVWLNSDALRISEMTGSVVVLFLWTFD